MPQLDAIEPLYAALVPLAEEAVRAAGQPAPADRVWRGAIPQGKSFPQVLLHGDFQARGTYSSRTADGNNPRLIARITAEDPDTAGAICAQLTSRITRDRLAPQGWSVKEVSWTSQARLEEGADGAPDLFHVDVLYDFRMYPTS